MRIAFLGKIGDLRGKLVQTIQVIFPFVLESETLVRKSIEDALRIFELLDSLVLRPKSPYDSGVTIIEGDSLNANVPDQCDKSILSWYASKFAYHRLWIELVERLVR